MINAAICDDNEAMLNFLSGKIGEIFTENGMEFELQQFHSGEEFLKNHENCPFDVVFMDIVMPDMNGFDLCCKIRQRHRYPVIMLTAKAEEEFQRTLT